MLRAVKEPGPNFIIKDLPTVFLILIIADQILYDTLCCSKQYNWCLSACSCKLLYSAFNIPNMLVWNMYSFAWNGLD